MLWRFPAAFPRPALAARPGVASGRGSPGLGESLVSLLGLRVPAPCRVPLGAAWSGRGSPRGAPTAGAAVEAPHRLSQELLLRLVWGETARLILVTLPAPNLRPPVLPKPPNCGISVRADLRCPSGSCLWIRCYSGSCPWIRSCSGPAMP